MDDETRRVVEIEAEIAETRVELSETIGAIQERLTPATIVANAKETMRQAATEKVREMTDNTFMDTVRANPVPAAMIGIGAAWLLLKGRSSGGKDDRTYGDWRSARGYDAGAYGGTREYAPVGTRGRSSFEGTSEAGEGLGERVSSIGRDVTSRSREVASDLGDTARHATRHAQLKFNDVLRDNPLLLGAAAALIGAAVGMSVPATEAENQLMGDARDAVVNRAQHMASDAAEKVSQAAGDVQHTAGSVADAASNVASSAGRGPAERP